MSLQDVLDTSDFFNMTEEDMRDVENEHAYSAQVNKIQCLQRDLVRVVFAFLVFLGGSLTCCCSPFCHGALRR